MIGPVLADLLGRVSNFSVAVGVGFIALAGVRPFD